MPTHTWTTAAPGDWYAEPEPPPRTITVMCQSCYRLNRVPEASSSALLACGRCGERFRVYNRQRAPWGSCVAGFFKDLFTNDATGRARWAIVMILATVAVIALLGIANGGGAAPTKAATTRLTVGTVLQGRPNPCFESKPVQAIKSYGRVFISARTERACAHEAVHVRTGPRSIATATTSTGSRSNRCASAWSAEFWHAQCYEYRP